MKKDKDNNTDVLVSFIFFIVLNLIQTKIVNIRIEVSYCCRQYSTILLYICFILILISEIEE